jgi:hypothetical protein
VGGLALALLGAWQEKRGRAESGRLVDLGLAWFIWGTLAQLADGVWFLLAQPQEIMLAFLGLSGPHTAVLWGGVAAALAAVGLAMKRRVWGAAGAVVATVTLMVVVRDLLRLDRLAPYFHPGDLTVAPQYSPALVFLGSLVLGLGVIIWMLKQAAQAGRES